MNNMWKWRQRLQKAVDDSGRSMKEISESAGLSHGYLHTILKKEQEMGISRLMMVCDALGVSSTYIIQGIELSDEDEEMLTKINADPDTSDAVRAVLRVSQGKG